MCIIRSSPTTLFHSHCLIWLHVRRLGRRRPFILGRSHRCIRRIHALTLPFSRVDHALALKRNFCQTSGSRYREATTVTFPDPLSSISLQRHELSPRCISDSYVAYIPPMHRSVTFQGHHPHDPGFFHSLLCSVSCTAPSGRHHRWRAWPLSIGWGRGSRRRESRCPLRQGCRHCSSHRRLHLHIGGGAQSHQRRAQWRRRRGNAGAHRRGGVVVLVASWHGASVSRGRRRRPRPRREIGGRRRSDVGGAVSRACPTEFRRAAAAVPRTRPSPNPQPRSDPDWRGWRDTGRTTAT